jgi:hypothetical protein
VLDWGVIMPVTGARVVRIEGVAGPPSKLYIVPHETFPEGFTLVGIHEDDRLSRYEFLYYAPDY